MARSSRSQDRLVFAAAFLFSLLICIWFGSAVSGVDWDDSYIFFRYAENLALGHGLSFNPGDPSRMSLLLRKKRANYLLDRPPEISWSLASTVRAYPEMFHREVTFGTGMNEHIIYRITP